MRQTAHSLQDIEKKLFSAVIADALDGLGYRNQSPNISFRAYTGIYKMVGRCKTTLWADMYHDDLNPYELELKAVDSCEPGDILIAAAGGSTRSGIWGELLSTAARNRGCRGAIAHGGIRDIAQMREMEFPVFATDTSIYDSLHRQRVIDIDIPVEIGGVTFIPGALLFCDGDGIIVIPPEVEVEAIENAMTKVEAENITRDEIRKGMKAADAYKKYGVL
ncbi:RraA family protein [Cyclobacteriaceae bacterium]|jgi:4-hydroxy-4-methyl-2-oxoglutarate aldolase|nr:RraA family protein [Cyclobacteriaceae bacterium]|tara:strand:+ start:504 stop:1163 length:660 start_codon:yes stop_codon:yes gene_type:complete